MVPSSLTVVAILFWHLPWFDVRVTRRLWTDWAQFLGLAPSAFVEALTRDIEGRSEVTAWVSGRGLAFHSVQLGSRPRTTAIAISTLDVEVGIARLDFIKKWSREGPPTPGYSHHLWANAPKQECR